MQDTEPILKAQTQRQRRQLPGLGYRPGGWWGQPKTSLVNADSDKTLAPPHQGTGAGVVRQLLWTKQSPAGISVEAQAAW